MTVRMRGGLVSRPIRVDICCWEPFRSIVAHWRAGQDDPRIWLADIFCDEPEDRWRIRLASFGPSRDDVETRPKGPTWPRYVTVTTGEAVPRALRIGDMSALWRQVVGCLDVARCDLGDLFNSLDNARTAGAEP